MLLDIAFGIFAAIIYATIYKTGLGFGVLLICILFALSPDLDFIISAIFNKKFPGHTHRDLFHYPIPFILLGSTCIALIFNIHFGILFAILSFAHFVHDTIGIGWGVPWLFPISRNYLKLTPFSNTVTHWWTPREQERIASKYGDPNWFKNIYLRPTLISMPEFIVFLIAIFVLIYFK